MEQAFSCYTSQKDFQKFTSIGGHETCCWRKSEIDDFLRLLFSILTTLDATATKYGL